MGLYVTVSCGCESKRYDDNGHPTCPEHGTGGCGYGRWVGGYGWFHAFRMTVNAELERAEWGSRFPLLMKHSDCDGGYERGQVAGLLPELDQIEKELAAVRYPIVRGLDADGNQLWWRAMRFEGGALRSSKGHALGVDEEGIVIYVNRRSRVGECKVFHYQELVKDDLPPELESIDMDSLFPSDPLGSPKPVKLVFDHASAKETFDGVVDALRGAGLASLATGSPIIYS